MLGWAWILQCLGAPLASQGPCWALSHRSHASSAPHQRVPCGCGEQLGLPLLPAEVCCQRGVVSLLSVPAGCDSNELTPVCLPCPVLPPWECQQGFCCSPGVFPVPILLWGCCAALHVQWGISGGAVGVPDSGMCLPTGSVPHLRSCLVKLSLHEVSVPVAGGWQCLSWMELPLDLQQKRK